MSNETQNFSQKIKEHSRKTHDSVDELVMSMQPFANTQNYGKFLQAQHEFHETLRPLYVDDTINQQFNNIVELGRADRVLEDMKALNVEPANLDIARQNPTDARRIGWLYCAEGSNVGAAILYKEAGKIELSDDHGAAHLAAHPDGRMRHWRSFQAKLDALELTEEETQEALKGADDAFAYFKTLIKATYS